MSEVVWLSEDLTDEEWLAEIEELGEQRGYFERIGKEHCALFLDAAPEVLIVSFDTIETARDGSAPGVPHAMLVAESRGWSHLSILSRGTTFFRDPAVFGYFDRLIDEAFFEDFDQVIFYGVGPAGYAACAFSVAAPGATVIAAAPLATLDTTIAPWEDRYAGLRRHDFTSRFGYAPDMLEAAEAAFILYDPTMDLDAMHAALFRGPSIHPIRLRHTGPRIGSELQEMNILGKLFETAAAGGLTPLSFYRAFRRRRDFAPYLRSLLNRVHIEEREFLTALLCRSVLSRKKLPQFQKQLETSEARLQAAGRALPPRAAHTDPLVLQEQYRR